MLTEIASAAEGSVEELLVAGGQSAGVVDEVLPVAAIVQLLVTEAEHALENATKRVI